MRNREALEMERRVERAPKDEIVSKRWKKYSADTCA